MGCLRHTPRLGWGIQPAAQVCALDWQWNLGPFSPGANTLTAEPHWPGLPHTFLRPGVSGVQSGCRGAEFVPETPGPVPAAAPTTTMWVSASSGPPVHTVPSFSPVSSFCHTMTLVIRAPPAPLGCGTFSDVPCPSTPTVLMSLVRHCVGNPGSVVSSPADRGCGFPGARRCSSHPSLQGTWASTICPPCDRAPGGGCPPAGRLYCPVV